VGKTNAQTPIRRKIHYKRNIRRYVILPTCLLVLNVVEEVVCYKAQVIGNPYLRAGILMLMFFCGFGLVGLVFAPLLTRSLEQVYFGGRKHGGYLGELIVLAALYGGLFYVYYLMYGAPSGVENLLPIAWHNTGQLL